MTHMGERLWGSFWLLVAGGGGGGRRCDGAGDVDELVADVGESDGSNGECSNSGA